MPINHLPAAMPNPTFNPDCAKARSRLTLRWGKMKKLAYIIFISMTLLSYAAFASDKADLVIVEKSKHLLTLYKTGKPLASYHVVFGGNPDGHKQQEGDERTPEGKYILDFKKADSAFYKAFHVSYPNAKDIEGAKKRGVSPGGDIMVHGQKNGWGWLSLITQRRNWTLGCIALANDDIDAMWELVDAGTPIEIKP